MKVLKTAALLGMLGTIVYMVSCLSGIDTAAANYKTYCGSCHVLPDPAQLPKGIWENVILPDMAARLGVRYNDYDPFERLADEEKLAIKLAGTYPEKPAISTEDWEAIMNYVLENAPESLEPDTLRAKRNSPLLQFEATPLIKDKKKAALTLHLSHTVQNNAVIGGDGSGEIWQWTADSGFTTLHQYRSGITGYLPADSGNFYLSIGQMHRNDLKKGELLQATGDSLSVVVKDLQRPVFLTSADVNGDGATEFLISEFGNKTGQLSLVRRNGNEYSKQVLLPFPGAINAYIKDMDGDGKLDIVVLFSQGDEGIYILYQLENLRFASKQAIRLNPGFGSRWFSMVDYDGDGDSDLAIASGDNSDYSFQPKDYHGIRLYLNDGNNFKESFFYPIYGASMVVAEDFDQDGDVDFAVSSFFPDFVHTPEESFVYLENVDAAAFSFKSYTTPASTMARWMVMTPADIDHDGDTDLLLGSFTFSPDRPPFEMVEYWRAQGVTMLLLENRLR